MYFDLTDEQKAIREALDSLLRDELDTVRAITLFDAADLDRELWHKLMEVGLGGVLVPTEQGGMGLDLLTLAVTAETLAYHGAPAPVIGNALAAWLLANAGSETQRERWVTPLMSGQSIAAFALLEPDRGWLHTDWTLTGPRISGIKAGVEWGGVANLFIVGLADGRLGLIEAGATGVEIRRIDSLDRTRPVAEVVFNEAPCEFVGDSAIGERLVDALLVLLAADACGAGRRAYTMAVEYAQVRTQFGQLIGSFQALKHQLANMAIDIEPCRPLYWYAAHAWDTLPDKRARAAANAKAHITEVAVKTARAAVEAHGGIGYTWEYPLHIYLKRAMYARTAMGLPSLHRERMATLAGW